MPALLQLHDDSRSAVSTTGAAKTIFVLAVSLLHSIAYLVREAALFAIIPALQNFMSIAWVFGNAVGFRDRDYSCATIGCAITADRALFDPPHV